MDRIIKHFEEKLADLELNISTRQQGIDARKAFGLRLGDELREVKKQIKAIASKGHSTKYLAKTRSELLETFQQNAGIVAHLKKDLSAMRHEAYCYTKAIESLNK